jgi:hypothetical protein
MPVLACSGLLPAPSASRRDLSHAGRRKMPALMRGADACYLSLTRRQIDMIGKVAAVAPFTAGWPSAMVPKTLPRCKTSWRISVGAIRWFRIRHPRSPTGSPVWSSIFAIFGGGGHEIGGDHEQLWEV